MQTQVEEECESRTAPAHGREGAALAYVGVEACWAFRARTGGRKAARLMAARALKAAASIAALPSALDPYSTYNATCAATAKRSTAELAALAAEARGRWVAFRRPDGRDARIVEGEDFARDHVRLSGHPMRFARVVGPVRHLSCDEAARFSCAGLDVDDVTAAMRHSAVSVGPHAMHFLGDPLSAQVVALDAAARDRASSGETIGALRRHLEAVRNVESGASSRGVATDVHAYDVVASAGGSQTWEVGISELVAFAARTWPRVVASEATVAVCRAIEAPISIFARVGADDVADIEAAEEYHQAVEAIADGREARASRTSHDLAHVSFDMDRHEERTARYAVERFLERSTRTVGRGLTGAGEAASLHEAAGSRYLAIDGRDAFILCCWCVDGTAAGEATFH